MARNPEVVFLFLPFISGDTSPDSKARSVEPVFTSLFLCVNNDFYNSLDSELQNILDEVIDETCAQIWDTAQTQAQEDLDYMSSEGGIEVYEPSDSFRQEMVEATAPMYDNMYETAPEVEEVINAIQAIQ